MCTQVAIGMHKRVILGKLQLSKLLNEDFGMASCGGPALVIQLKPVQTHQLLLLGYSKQSGTHHISLLSICVFYPQLRVEAITYCKYQLED